MLDNNASDKTKALAAKALAYDFKVETNSPSNTRTAITEFLKENGMSDTFQTAFSQWQGGTDTYCRIKVNAAIAKLKGMDGQLLTGEAEHWEKTREVTHFSDAWEEGTLEAMALIPYIAASQQKIKALESTKGVIKTVYRGLDGKAASTSKKAHKVAKQAKTKRVFMGGGGQGYSMNKSTAKKFAKADGVIFTKDNISSDNVLLYLNSWIDGSYTYEEEMILDPSSTQQFSLNELHYEGEPGW